MTKDWSTKIVTLMSLRAGILVQGCGHIYHIKIRKFYLMCLLLVTVINKRTTQLVWIMPLGILRLVSSESGSRQSSLDQIPTKFVDIIYSFQQTLCQIPLSLETRSLHMRQVYDRLTAFVSPLGTNFFGVYLSCKITAILRLVFILHLLVFRTKFNIV